MNLLRLGEMVRFIFLSPKTLIRQLWKNFLKKLLTRRWSCDRVKKLSRKTKTRQRNKPKTCPAGFGTHSQPYMRTRQKCNPEYIPLYLRSSMNNYIVHDQRSSLKRPGPRGQKHDPHGSWWGNSEDMNCRKRFERSKDQHQFFEQPNSVKG